MSCCQSSSCATPKALSDAEIVKAVTESYGARALTAGDDTVYAQNVAAAFGYTAEQLQTIPTEANMGLSCGNPTGTASIKEGERVLDLGSGGGMDVFLAAEKVGPSGSAIGLDGSQEMIALARRNAAKKGLKPPQVAFVPANLEKDLPIESNSVDCVISNCVINLLPASGKKNVLKEVHRVLKPGGRLVFDDLIAKKPLPVEMRADIDAKVGCVSEALISEAEYRQSLTEVGFQELLLIDKKKDLSIYWEAERAGGCGASKPTSTTCGAQSGQSNHEINEWMASYQIYALKPKSEGEVAVSKTVLKDWHTAYPTVKSSPPVLTNDEVRELVRSDAKDFVVVDVRRNDHAGGHVRGSEQWPAQTYYDDLPAFFEKHKETKKVIFYCNRSTGRGPRSAGWYQDYLNDQGVEASSSQAFVMQGGIKGWLEKYDGQEDLVDRD